MHGDNQQDWRLSYIERRPGRVWAANVTLASLALIITVAVISMLIALVNGCRSMSSETVAWIAPHPTAASQRKLSAVYADNFPDPPCPWCGRPMDGTRGRLWTSAASCAGCRL